MTPATNNWKSTAGVVLVFIGVMLAWSTGTLRFSPEMWETQSEMIRGWVGFLCAIVGAALMWPWMGRKD